MTSRQQSTLDIQSLSAGRHVWGSTHSKGVARARGNDRPKRAFQLESSALSVLAVTSSDLPTPWPQLPTQGGSL